MGTAGDTAIVLTSLTWLIANVFLLGIAGYAEFTIDVPASPYEDQAAVNETTTTRIVNRVVCAVGVSAGAIAGGAGAALLSGGVGTIVGATFVGGLVGSLIGCDKVQQIAKRVLDFAEIIFDYFGFLFQLLLFSVPGLPIWLNAIIVLPPGSALAFVGLKTIRGAGG